MLWIKAQTRDNLYRLNMIAIQCDKCIIGFNSMNPENIYYLGEYISRERALQVIDEIAKILALPTMEDGINLYPNFVFEMPQS